MADSARSRLKRGLARLPCSHVQGPPSFPVPVLVLVRAVTHLEKIYNLTARAAIAARSIPSETFFLPKTRNKLIN